MNTSGKSVGRKVGMMERLMGSVLRLGQMRRKLDGILSGIAGRQTDSDCWPTQDGECARDQSTGGKTFPARECHQEAGESCDKSDSSRIRLRTWRGKIVGNGQDLAHPAISSPNKTCGNSHRPGEVHPHAVLQATSGSKGQDHFQGGLHREEIVAAVSQSPATGFEDPEGLPTSTSAFHSSPEFLSCSRHSTTPNAQ